MAINQPTDQPADLHAVLVCAVYHDLLTIFVRALESQKTAWSLRCLSGLLKQIRVRQRSSLQIIIPSRSLIKMSTRSSMGGRRRARRPSRPSQSSHTYWSNQSIQSLQSLQITQSSLSSSTVLTYLLVHSVYKSHTVLAEYIVLKHSPHILTSPLSLHSPCRSHRPGAQSSHTYQIAQSTQSLQSLRTTQPSSIAIASHIAIHPVDPFLTAMHSHSAHLLSPLQPSIPIFTVLPSPYIL